MPSASPGAPATGASASPGAPATGASASPGAPATGASASPGAPATGASASPGAPGLELTGERTLPGIDRENYWFRRHEAVYRWVAERGGTGPVVEAGCGEGYGAALLAHALSAPVIALEYDEAACEHVRVTYPSVPVVRANLAAMPVTSGAAGLVVSLQVIEHLWDLPGFLRDAGRILRPGGRLVVSTPNRLTFSPGLERGARPVNPFHVEEFDDEQLHGLLADAGFADVTLHGLHHGPRLAEEDRRLGPIVAAQVDAITAGTWSGTLAARVTAVTTDDFVVHPDTGSSLDLIATGTRP